MYKTVKITCFTKVFYVAAFGAASILFFKRVSLGSF